MREITPLKEEKISPSSPGFFLFFCSNVFIYLVNYYFYHYCHPIYNQHSHQCFSQSGTQSRSGASWRLRLPIVWKPCCGCSKQLKKPMSEQQLVAATGGSARAIQHGVPRIGFQKPQQREQSQQRHTLLYYDDDDDFVIATVVLVAAAVASAVAATAAAAEVGAVGACQKERFGMQTHHHHHTPHHNLITPVVAAVVASGNQCVWYHVEWLSHCHQLLSSLLFAHWLLELLWTAATWLPHDPQVFSLACPTSALCTPVGKQWREYWLYMGWQ